MCTEKGITTCSTRKGPRPKEEAECLKTTRKIIGNLRATIMEGSFGNQNNTIPLDVSRHAICLVRDYYSSSESIQQMLPFLLQERWLGV